MTATTEDATTPTYTAEIVTAAPEVKEYNYSRDCAGSGNWIDRSCTKSAIRKDARADLKAIKTEKKNLDELARLDYKRSLLENKMWYNQEKSNIKQAERTAIEDICTLSYWRNR